MKKRKMLTGFLAAVMMLSQFGEISTPVVAATDSNTMEQGMQVDIIFTHDLHSHLNSFNTVVDGESMEVGGFSRIKTIIEEKKAENPDTLILDGGDFSMGTLVQTVYEDQAAELRMLGELGCEVTTLGNHEFD